MRLALRALGWLLIAAGAVVALYLVYSLYWTGLETSRSQDRLMQEFEESIGGDFVAAAPTEGDDFDLETAALDPLSAEDPSVGPATAPTAAEVGDAVGVMEFRRPATGQQVVTDPVVVVEGITTEALQSGPGRYPGTAYPGQTGNFAVAGHRTTYGAPFWDLDQLEAGDEIHVTDRNGTRWVYEFAESRIVGPQDVSVIGEDPLGTGAPTLTLTTCHPRWSQTERLIVFATLSSDQVPLALAS
ncbi:class E sortase [Euzebya sp.]|uniref:class E sortase n=1 Tax=Euzebya sp. TaxID=1971409 RepID=UPI003512C51A